MIKRIDKLVVLDAGHGGHDPGAVNKAAGIEEAPMALDVTRKAATILSPYCDVTLTRSDDRFLTLSERPAIANRVGADLFVSYHFNSGSSQKTASSYEGFTTRGQNNSDKLATACLKYHGQLFQEQKLRADRRDGDPDKEANFAVLRPTDCPSFLMEGEFIHTAHGAALIADPKNRQKMALAIALGCLEYFGHTEAVKYLLVSAGLLSAHLEEVVAKAVQPPENPAGFTDRERIARLEKEVFGTDRG